MTWEKVKLGDVCTVVNGFAFDSKKFNDEKKGIPLIRIRDVIRGYSETFFDGEYSDDYLINNGDALIGMDGEFNLSIWKGGQAILNQRVCRIFSNYKHLSQNYLIHFLPIALKEIESRTPFVTVKHLSSKELKNIGIPLPPLSEQIRIAAILDQADELRRKRRLAVEKLDALLQSVFIDMFGDPVSNPKGWEVNSLKSITTKIGSGSTPKGGDNAYKDDGIALIRSLNIHDGKFTYKNLAYIDDEQANKLKNVIIEKNDVLLNITGASVARCCVVPNDVIPARVNQHVAILRTTKNIIPEFLMSLLTCQPMKISLLNIAGAGATREALTKQQLQDLIILTPPLEQQIKFLEFYSHIKILKEKMLTELDYNLFQSLQQKAFNGEL